MIGITIRRKAKQFGSPGAPLGYDAREPARRANPSSPRRGQLGVTFIGHSSFLLQIGGKNILVDPNFARWIFVLKRLRRPGLRLRDLPPIDAVLVSHAHFDHLHRPSLRAIARLTRWRSGKRPVIIVPRHVRDLVSDLGFGRIIELDWWESCSSAASRSRMCRRATGERASCATCIADMAAMFCASGKHSVYHAGDTAYFDGFREIGERLRPDLALLPIGAYHPDSYRAVHTSPEDAVQAFMDLGARWMVPMHYGTSAFRTNPLKSRYND